MALSNAITVATAPSEYQGIRDRSIDIALQNLGYKVLRYTGSQIRDNIKAVVDNVINSSN